MEKKTHLFFILIPLMQVLITKLRSANTVETKQYRKASKALLVLIPLFGITYLVVLWGPNEGTGSHIFACARAFLLSSQVNIIKLKIWSFEKSELLNDLIILKSNNVHRFIVEII
jgi:corticotropin releasing hormone receptor 1